MKLYNACTTNIGGKEYTIKDNAGVYPIDRLLGENESYYGGRVTKFSRAKDNEKFILLIEDTEKGLKVIDVAVENLMDFPREVLKVLAKRKKIKYAQNITTEDLAALLT